MRLIRLLVGGFVVVGLVWLFLPQGLILPISSAMDELHVDSRGSIQGSAGAISLFSGSEDADVPWTSRTPAAKRVRKIFPDPAWMTPEPTLKEGDVITLALFDDAVFVAKLRKVTCYVNGGVGMTADLQGDYSGMAYLSYCEGELLVYVEPMGASDYGVYFRNGAHYALEVDLAESEIRASADAIRPDSTSVSSSDSSYSNDAVVAADSDASTDSDDTDSADESSDSGDSVEVDVMVLYTPAAVTNAGSVASVVNNINLRMANANTVHENSETHIELNLVYSEEVDYVESGVDYDDLVWLAGDDDVQSLRDECEADLVCMISVMADNGGIAYSLGESAGDPDYAFSTVWIDQSLSTYTFAHELGHNMGAGHSKTQTSSPGPQLYSYSAGWQWDDVYADAIYTSSSYDDEVGYCTVMTYRDFDGDGDIDYVRRPYFSSPLISYESAYEENVTGDETDGDNARTIRNTRYAVASYRGERSVISDFPYSTSFEEESVGKWTAYEGDVSWLTDDGSDSYLSNGYSGTLTADDGSVFLMTDAYSSDSIESACDAIFEATFDFTYLSSVEFGFSYYMDSTDTSSDYMGDLFLEVSCDTGESWVSEWSLSGNQGAGWQEASVDLSAYAGLSDVYVRYRAVLGSDWEYTYMQVDSLSVTGTDDLDIDDDGLPNEWESLYYGDDTSADPTATASNGVNTVLEAYIAGIDPTATSSFFEMNSYESTASGFVVSWSAVSGRVYSVHRTTNLVETFLSAESNILWPQSSWTDSVSRAKAFYQVEVELEP